MRATLHRKAQNAVTTISVDEQMKSIQWGKLPTVGILAGRWAAFSRCKQVYQATETKFAPSIVVLRLVVERDVVRQLLPKLALSIRLVDDALDPVEPGA